MSDQSTFVPLRTDPPPILGSTLWTRSALALTILFTAVSVLVTELRDRSGGVFSAPMVVIPHVAVLALLIVWSAHAMANVNAMVPPSRYSPAARGKLAGVLWAVGFVTPAAAVVAVGRLGSQFADTEEVVPTLATIALVLVALLAAWLPFRYHARHAARIGAPHLIMIAWFWVPLLTFVGGLTLLAFAYSRRLGGDEPIERAVNVGAIYGLAAGVFGWSTWRAVTVFDEVIDLRWRRWKIEWEQTLAAMAAEPAPGPER